MYVLLAHRADVNLATEGFNSSRKIAFDCSGAPGIAGRTALMYAAENASASTIKVLLDPVQILGQKIVRIVLCRIIYHSTNCSAIANVKRFSSA